MQGQSVIFGAAWHVLVDAARRARDAPRHVNRATRLAGPETPATPRSSPRSPATRHPARAAAAARLLAGRRFSPLPGGAPRRRGGADDGDACGCAAAPSWPPAPNPPAPRRRCHSHIVLEILYGLMPLTISITTR